MLAQNWNCVCTEAKEDQAKKRHNQVQGKPVGVRQHCLIRMFVASLGLLFHSDNRLWRTVNRFQHAGLLHTTRAQELHGAHPNVSVGPLASRLSFPATGPPDTGRVSEGFQKGSLKGFRRGLWRVLEGVSRGPLQKPFREPSETPSETLPVSGGPVAGNESLEAREPRTGKSPKMLPGALSRVLSEIRVLSGVLPRVAFLLPSTQNNRKATLESTLGSTPESTLISESTLESTLGDFPVLGSLAGQQTRNAHPS